MRLKAIQNHKERVRELIPECSAIDISGQIVSDFRVQVREPLKRRLARTLALPLLRWTALRLRSRLGAKLPFRPDVLCLEERFGTDASLGRLLKEANGRRVRRVLVPGCYLGGEDVQFWLRRNVSCLQGIDLYNLGVRWEGIVSSLGKAFPGTSVSFRQAAVEQMPFDDGSFDLVATSAVLEHVQNLRAMAKETARVLREGGLAWHGFGPLYWSFSGDHCMSAYGEQAGYDHLLLEDGEYEARIWDQSFFNRLADPNLPFWARRQQFSFATAEEYIAEFAQYFRIVFVVANIGAKALRFRREYPLRWESLLTAGVNEADLLVKGLFLVLEKI